MFRGRFVMVALVAVLLVGLVLAGVSGAQRSAWFEGYMMGQLVAAGSDGAVSPAAYLPYVYGHRGFGFGGFLFLLVGGGVLFLIFSRLAMGRHRGWAMEHGQHGGQGSEHFGPWMRHFDEWCREQKARAEGEQQGEAQPPASPAQGESAPDR